MGKLIYEGNVRVDFDDRDVLLELDPEAFYLTDHYRAYPAMLVRLKQVQLDMLERLLEQGWRRQATKRLLAEYELKPGK